MTKIWKPLELSIYKSWLDAILSEASDSLNDWENNFIESMLVRIVERGLPPSERQADILERIYSEKTK